ncbi:MAG: glycosyltransferase family 2 protein, partial [Ignavibacteria bacterium]|nr:glycosyltransferase family 2 protein [Ignavibacteria bacterium]
MPKELSIIIVNYNTTEFIKNCINSIKSNINQKDFEIIVVDNNSDDRSIESLTDEYPDVKFIWQNSNRGFGAGCNIGIKNSESQYILLLNPDIEVKTNAIEILLQYIKSHHEVAICSGILLDQNNNVLYSYNDFPGLSWEFREAYGLFLKSKIKKLTTRKEIIEKLPFEVDWFHGACMMIRKDIFEKVNGFDENIFLYYEDVDLCKKIKNLGYKIVCIPTAKFFHYERG